MTIIERLAREATFLRRHAKKGKGGKRLPALWLFTDPYRIPDPGLVMANLPRGAGVVYRAFGKQDAISEGRRLVKLARQRGLTLLVGRDLRLARAIGADGVHFPEYSRLGRQTRPWRGAIFTVAAHGAKGIARCARLQPDLVFLSSAFASKSPSAKQAWGATRFSALVRHSQRPVVALGGVTVTTAKRLRQSGAYGLAAVEELAKGAMEEPANRRP